MSLPRRQKPIVFDFISISLVILAITLFLYSTTFRGTEIADLSMVAVVLLLAGLTMSFLVGKVRIDFRLSSRESLDVLVWTGVSMGAIFVVNLVRHLKFEVAPMDPRLFSILIGISEEMFFRVFLTAWLIMLVGEMLGIMLGSSIWTVFHLFTYQTDPSALAVIFGAGLVLGYAFVKSRRASPVMLAHCSVNAVASIRYAVAAAIAVIR